MEKGLGKWGVWISPPVSAEAPHPPRVGLLDAAPSGREMNCGGPWETQPHRSQTKEKAELMGWCATENGDRTQGPLAPHP